MFDIIVGFFILRASPTAAGPSAVNCGLAIFAGLVGLAGLAGLVADDSEILQH